MLDALMSLSDIRQRHALPKLEARPACFQRAIQISSRGKLRLYREVIATKEVDLDVLEDHGPEWNGLVWIVRGVGRECSSLPQKLDVPLHVRSKRNFNDVVDALRSNFTYSGNEVIVVEQHVMCSSAASSLLFG